MKRQLLYFFMLFVNIVFAQGEGNIWCFGFHAGINFNSGLPVALTGSVTDTNEGCATISDSQGNLLFYTDGVTVWDRSHNQMPNGLGLKGNFSSTQSAIIIPKPDSDNLFYVFTVSNNGTPDGLNFSEVDMNLNGSFGDVTSNKNIQLHTPSCEKIAAVKKGNGEGYWLVSHFFGTNEFYVYSVSNIEVNLTPTIISIGTTISSNNTNNALGYLKFSADGKKLVAANGDINTEIYNFNDLTGQISEPEVIFIGRNYGVEFSPSSDVLYLSASDDFSNIFKLYQFNLLASDVYSSKNLIYSSTTDDQLGALQLGPDGKIYLAINFRNYVSVINNPDEYGLNCNFQENAVNLINGICIGGLPQFVQSTFKPLFKVANFCFNSATQFTLESSIVPLSVSWDFGDSQTSTDINPVHQYGSTGSYNVTVSITTANGVFTKTKIVSITQQPIIANTINDQVACGNNLSTYSFIQFNNSLLGTQSTNEFGIDYFLSMADAVNHSNVFPPGTNLQSGITTIYAKVFNKQNRECAAYTSFLINITTLPVANSPTNIFICDDPSNDELGVFNLQSNSATILGNQNTSQFIVSYHLNQNEADSNSNPLPVNFQNTTNPQTIYARIQNNQNTSCFATTTFQIGLNKMPTANQPQNLFLCDDENNDGFEVFDLTPNKTNILGTQAINEFSVSFHGSLSNAQNNTNPLSTSYSNSTNPQLIYARIQNSTSPSCFDTTSFQLKVMPKPVLEIEDNYSICEGVPINITAPIGFSSYNWSTGSTTATTLINQAGNYSLTVTKDYSNIVCETTKNITVYNSNSATITQIETKDWTDNQNTITILVDGDGEYEYSIDGVNYQDSNVFSGLNSGEYTVFVNDKKGCGTAIKEVFLLMYPKFFTPNGDGYNDIWQIRFSITEPNMEIMIFDRYGRIIKSFKGTNIGWDGTFNGNLLFADDYWFVVKRQNGKEYKGHFALKR